MKDRVVLVTGSTDGIGQRTAHHLARRGATVVLHGRSPERCRAAMKQIRSETGNSRLDFVAADLASLNQVRELADTVQARYDRLHVLINNAGVLMNERTLTEDGFETTFAVNHLAHFLLTIRLQTILVASAPSRVITVSSGTHHGASMAWDDLQGEQRFDGYRAYAQSKLANVLFAYELAERLAGTGVTSNCLHPGVVATKLLRAGWGGGGNLDEGAATSVYLASALEVEGVTGEYFVAKRIAPSSPAARDRKLQSRLWGVSQTLIARVV